MNHDKAILLKQTQEHPDIRIKMAIDFMIAGMSVVRISNKYDTTCEAVTKTIRNTIRRTLKLAYGNENPYNLNDDMSIYEIRRAKGLRKDLLKLLGYKPKPEGKFVNKPIIKNQTKKQQ